MKGASRKLVQALQYLTWDDVCSLSSLSRSTIRRQIKRGEFPSPVTLSPKRVAFKAEEVEAALERKSLGETAVEDAA